MFTIFIKTFSVNEEASINLSFKYKTISTKEKDNVIYIKNGYKISNSFSTITLTFLELFKNIC